MPSHLPISENIFKDGDEDDEEEDEAGPPEGYEEEEEEEEDEEEDEAGSELGEGEEVGLSYLMREEIQVNRPFLAVLKISYLGIELNTMKSKMCRNLSYF